MIIGIDGTRGINEKAGIGRYTYNLVWQMARMQDIDTHFLFTAMRSLAQKKRQIKNLVDGKPYVLKRIPGEWKNSIWGGPISWPDKWIKDVELWHAPSIWEAPLATKKPLIITIHDLTPFLFPDLRGEKVSKNQQKRTIQTASRADGIICVSQATANDLIKVVPQTKSKIAVVPLGVEARFRTLNYIKREKIILTVGTVEPRKNLVLLFKAFRVLPDNIKRDYTIWVVGASGWRNSNIFKEAKKLGNKIKFWGFVNDEKLIEIYNRSQIFAFPSLYEGFGLPLLEAMACGLPIIANNISSIPEVVGEAGLLLPQTEEAWKSGLMRIIEDEKKRNSLRAAGLKRVKKYSWQNMAQKTIKVYKLVKGKKFKVESAVDK